MMMKRISAGLLALALSVSAFAVSASADDPAPRYAENAQAMEFEWVDESRQADAPKAVSAVRDANGITLKWEQPTGSFDGYIVKAVHPSGENSGIWYVVIDKNTTSTYWNYHFDQTKNWDYFVVTYTNDVYGNKVFGKQAKFDVRDNNAITAPPRVEFTGSSKTSTTVELDWAKLDCDGYQIDFKSQNAAEWRTLGTLGGNETHVKISKLKENTTYYVRLRAFRKNGSENLYGSYSEERVITTDSGSSATITDNTQAPGSVTIKREVNSADSIRIYWDAIACDGYQIYFNKTGGDNDWQFIANVNKNTTDYRFDNLEAEHDYWISICAYKYDKNNNPVYGSFTKKKETTAKKGTSVEKVGKPASPTILTDKCTVGYDSVVMKWNGVNCDGYELYINEGSSWRHVATVAGDVTSYTFKKLTPNKDYYFAVGAFNKHSNGEQSELAFNAVSNNLYARTKNSASTNVARPATPQFYNNYSRTKNAIRLNWSPVNCDGYFIYRYDYNRKAWVRVSIVKGGNTTTKRFSNLNPGTTYVFKMRAYKQNGSSKVYSLYSNNKSVTTKN